MRELHLPSYATAVAPGRINMEGAQFYPEILAELGVSENEITQYDLELARQIAYIDCKVAVAGTSYQVPDQGGAAVFRFTDATKADDPEGKSKYRQDRYPEGKGVVQARKDLKSVYANLRGISIA